MSDSLVTVTPTEHGNAVLVTIRVQKNTFAIGFDPAVANIVSYNMLDSLETLAQEALETGATTTTVDAGAEGSLTAADIITLNKLREQVAILREGNFAPIQGNSYAVIAHPDIMYDLMTATAATDWAQFVTRSGPGEEWMAGEVARAAGLSFLETPRAAVSVNAGDTNVDTYSTYILAQDALGKAETIPGHIVPGPVTDKLRRFMPLGWHAYLGYKTIRSGAARNLIAASSIGTN